EPESGLKDRLRFLRWNAGPRPSAPSAVHMERFEEAGEPPPKRPTERDGGSPAVFGLVGVRHAAAHLLGAEPFDPAAQSPFADLLAQQGESRTIMRVDPSFGGVRRDLAHDRRADHSLRHEAGSRPEIGDHADISEAGPPTPLE